MAATKARVIYVERAPRTRVVHERKVQVQTEPQKKDNNPIFEAMSFFGSTTRAGFKKLNEADRKR